MNTQFLKHDNKEQFAKSRIASIHMFEEMKNFRGQVLHKW